MAPTFPTNSCIFQASSSDDGTQRVRVIQDQNNDYRMVVFGAGGVGKSSLVGRFVCDSFRDSYVPTVEDTYRKVISANKQVCTLQIIDTSGSHQFPAMRRLNMSSGHAFLLVYSVTSKQTMHELKPIIEELRANKGGSIEGVPIMLVGNKTDEEGKREVRTEIGVELAKMWKVGFVETSAKTNQNVKELFQELLQMEKKRNMSLNTDKQKTKSQLRREKLKGQCQVM